MLKKLSAIMLITQGPPYLDQLPAVTRIQVSF